MFFKFKDFVIKLAKRTKFERFDMIKFFKEEIQTRVSHIRSYKNEFKNEWEKWLSKKSGSDVAAFFKKHGKKLLSDWLCKVFPFNEKKLKIKFEIGGTNVDIILHVQYTYSHEEVVFMIKTLKENAILTINEEIALIRILAETILSFPLIWTEFVGYEFTIMPENESKSWKKNSFMVDLDFSARPSY
ncbi:MAG: hypothetical protein ACXQS8_04590 [Candidatus Helarchaeales archaeon]